jgi:4-amino-4-deoxy-L-arabinose transferase-like glycosyltransferase
MVLMLMALGLRLGWGLTRPGEIDPRLPDQREYLESAGNLLQGQGLKFVDPRFDQEIYAYRMPGYPLFLAGLGASVRLARMAQALLDASTVGAVYLLARRWLGPGPSLAAAALAAFNPFLVYFSSLILSETLFTAMLAWGMVLLAWRRNYLWGGVVLALSILVRPAAVALPVALGIGAVFIHDQAEKGEREKGSDPFFRLRLPVGAAMLLLTVLALLPWAVRNRQVLGSWIWLTTNGGVTRYDGFNSEAVGDGFDLTSTGASDQSFFQSPEMAGIRHASEVERDRELARRANGWIVETWRERPGDLIRLTAAKIARTWSPVPLSSDFGSKWIYVAAALLYSIPLDVLVVLGLWQGRLPRVAKAFLLLPAAYVTAIHAISVGSLRYRVPVEPVLAVVAAGGLAILWESVRRRGV